MMDEDQELEWASRQYAIATQYLMDVLLKYDDIPLRIFLALDELADAINDEWLVEST
jgi:hypothetical protein